MVRREDLVVKAGAAAVVRVAVAIGTGESAARATEEAKDRPGLSHRGPG